MSIAKVIIYKSDDELKSILKKRPKLDFIDEYGYTPLIQAAIMNSVSKTKLLLKSGANVDFADLTGRTSLFWAADNNNIELCKLLLKHHANPNVYSCGGQPALVMPLMKKHKKVKELLSSSGAKLDFADDFLNAKLIGHSFELEGRIDIVDTKNTFIEVELEGFYLKFTLEIVANSLADYRNNFAAKKMRGYFHHLDRIIYSLRAAIELIRLQHYLIDVKSFVKKIDSLLNTDLLILPISFGGHAITLTRYWDKLIRCDRGAYGREHGTVIYYDMRYQHNLTKTFCRDLLYKRQYPTFIDKGLINHLGLEPKKTLGIPVQKTGNCSWANVEAIIPALMFILLLEERMGQNEQECEQEAIHFYHEWREWNKNRSLDFCIQSFKEANDSRKASKAALLSSILFQAYNVDNPEDRQKSSKILAILSQPNYIPVLKCYAQTFKKAKNNPLWRNFNAHLEEYGIDIEKLLK